MKTYFQVNINDTFHSPKDSSYPLNSLSEGVVNFCSLNMHELREMSAVPSMRLFSGCGCTKMFNQFCDNSMHVLSSEVFYFMLFNSFYDCQLKTLFCPNKQFIDENFPIYWNLLFRSPCDYGDFGYEFMRHIDFMYKAIPSYEGENFYECLQKIWNRFGAYLSFIDEYVLENYNRPTWPQLPDVQKYYRYSSPYRLISNVLDQFGFDYADVLKPSYQLNYYFSVHELYSEWKSLGMGDKIDSVYSGLYMHQETVEEFLPFGEGVYSPYVDDICAVENYVIMYSEEVAQIIAEEEVAFSDDTGKIKNDYDHQKKFFFVFVS